MAFASAIIAILLSYFPSSSSSSTFAITRSASGCFDSIVSLGDSLADTGNYIRLCPADKPAQSARSPYGRNFFHRPTGRYSDGRIVIDFIAQSLGLPLVPPYLGGEEEGRSFGQGVNFAVAGATALDKEYYEKRGIHNEHTNASLRIQLDWFKQFLATVPDGRSYLEKSLVLMGEIGGNDYNHALDQDDVNIQVIKSFVPLVIQYVGAAIQELIELGAETLLVPGITPLGCIPAYLTQFRTSSTAADYDPETGCLNWLNELAMHHNEMLLEELNRLRQLYPRIELIYADYYNAALALYASPNEYGFTGGNLRACCGSGGPYNYNRTAQCGSPPATSCDDPSSVANWDGIHFTEAAYRVMAQGLLEGPYTTPHIRTLCPSIPSTVARV